MKNDNKLGQKYLILEIILIIIGILLAIALCLIMYKNYRYKEISHEYDFNAYKIESNENSITITTYHKDGNRIKDQEIEYFENGKIVKSVNKYYYNSINLAQYEYEKDSSNKDIYDVTLEKNAVIHTYNNPELSFDTDEKSKEIEEFYNKVTTNKEIIDYVLQNIDKDYKKDYTRIY